MTSCFDRSRNGFPACCAWWSVRVLTLDYPAAGTASCGSFCTRVSVAAGIPHFFEFGALVAVQGFWRAENADNTLSYGMGYCSGSFITQLEPALQTVLGSPSSRYRIYIRSLRLKLTPICRRPSQPIFFGRAARQVSGLLGALVCCVLFFVVDTQAWHCSHQSRTSLLMVGHQYLWRILS